MSQKKPAAKPAWIKNTFFWIAGILFLLSVAGLIGGNAVIRDPGQKIEKIPLWLIYLVASVVMAANGIMSHRQTEQQYQEETEENNP